MNSLQQREKDTKEQPTSSFEVSTDEMKFFLAILIASGYCILPRRDIYRTHANSETCQEKIGFNIRC